MRARSRWWCWGCWEGRYEGGEELPGKYFFYSKESYIRVISRGALFELYQFLHAIYHDKDAIAGNEIFRELFKCLRTTNHENTLSNYFCEEFYHLYVNFVPPTCNQMPILYVTVSWLWHYDIIISLIRCQGGQIGSGVCPMSSL